MIKFLFALVASLLLAFGSNIATSATITWTNTAGGNWNVAANWNSNAVPGAGDTAVITNNSITVTLNTSPTVGGITLGANSGCGGGTILLMNGQTLSLRGPLAVGTCGQFTVDSGTLSGTSNAILSGVIGWTGGTLSGTLTLAASGTLNILGGAGFNDLPNCTLTNLGTVIWSSGHIRGGNGGTTIYNSGLWDCQSDLVFDNNIYSGTVNFINLAAGTLRKSAGTNTTTLGPGLFLNNTGTLDVKTNYLSLNSGGNFTGGSVTSASGIIQLTAGAFTINGTITTTNFQLNGGTLTGNNVLSGSFTWVAGSWSGAAVTVTNTGWLNILGGAGFNDLPNCTFTNNGTVAWNSGHIRGNGSTVIDNAGLWDCRADLLIDNSTYGGTMNFVNLGSGIFRKSVGTNATTLGSGLFLNNSGSLDVQTNYLSMAGGGSLTGGLVTSTSGVIQLAAGIYTINGTITTTNVQLTGGTLTGVNVINGGLTWVVGSWSGAVVTVAGGSLLNILGGANFNDLPNCTVTNNGTVAWNSGHIRGGNSGTLINNSGLWDCRADLLFDNNAYGGTVNFINSGPGTLRKSVGTNATTLGPGLVLNNSGTLDVLTNYLSLAGGGNFTGGLVTSTPGIIQLAAGNFTINGTTTTTNVQLNGATLAGANIIKGGFTWVAGTWNGALVTVATNSLLNILGGAGNNDLPNCTMTNNGTVAWSSGHIRGGGGSSTLVNNLGLWDCQSDQVFDNAAYGGNVNFLNSGPGKIRKSSGTGLTTLGSGVFLINSGTLDSQTGTLSVQGTYSLTNGTLNFGIGSLSSFGTINLTGAAGLSGSVSANLNNGYVPVSGSSFAVLTYGSATGLFTNAILPFAAAWKTNYAATVFSLQVSNSRPQYAAMATQFVNELTLLRVTNLAVDLDTPTQTVTNNLVSAPISGLAFNTIGGVITWTPAQTNSPSTNAVSVSATDNGVPPLSATNTFIIIVREVNVAPTFPAPAPTNVNALALLTVTNRATESNIHSTNSGYTLISQPAGMAISTNGVITWTPGQSQGHITNTITTVITNYNPFDLINPNLTATNSFTVIVYAPAFAPIVNFTNNVGRTVSFTASAMDNDSTRTLTYSLGTAPASATINPASGLFSWRPPVTSAGSSNSIQARVTANSTPSFTATQSFFIKVSNLTAVTLRPIAKTATNFQMQITGPVGPDYILQVTNSLSKTNWVNLLTNTPAASPFNVTDILVNTFTDRYYRVKLGP